MIYCMKDSKGRQLDLNTHKMTSNSNQQFTNLGYMSPLRILPLSLSFTNIYIEV